MRWLCENRGERVREDNRLRFGEVHFRPQQDRAEMSEDTWKLIENDADKSRAYVIARSRAMRTGQSSAMNLIGQADRTKVDALAVLEAEVGTLLSAIHAVDEPSEFATGDLIRRRQRLRAELLQVQARIEAVAARFEVIDEVLGSKVLA